MKPPKLILKFAKIFLFGLVLLAVSSCSKDNVSSPENNLGKSKILLINSTNTVSAIDLYWTGNKLNTVPLLTGNTTGYQSVTAGTRDIQIKAANLSNTILATGKVKLTRDSSYTLFVYTKNSATAIAMAEDDLSLPSFGNAKVKFANLSSGSSSADLVVTSGPVLSSSVSFGTISPYIELKAGTYNLNLLEHGTNKIMLSIPNVRVDNGKIYTIWSGGTVNGIGASALMAQTISQ